MSDDILFISGSYCLYAPVLFIDQRFKKHITYITKENDMRINLFLAFFVKSDLYLDTFAVLVYYLLFAIFSL